MNKRVTETEVVTKINKKRLSKRDKKVLRRWFATILISMGMGALVAGTTVKHSDNKEIDRMEQDFDDERKDYQKEIEELTKDRDYLAALTESLSKQSPTPTPEDKKPTQTPDKPEGSIDVPIEKYTINNGDTLEKITEKVYEAKIKEVLKAKGVDDVDNSAYYEIQYLYKNIARINIEAGLIPNMNTLYAGNSIYLIDENFITVENIDKICSAGAQTFSVDIANGVATILPVNENTKSR